jgi:ATP-binding cassette subfamily B protein
MMVGRNYTPVTRQKITPGTIRRIIPYAWPYRWGLALLLVFTVVDAADTAVSPLVLGMIIDKGIIPRHLTVVVELTLLAGVLAVLDGLARYITSVTSARIGQGVIYDLRTRVFDHVLRQPLAFFNRAQTGSLVSRLNTDVMGAQQAVTTLLSQAVSTILTLIFVVSAMFYLSWQITIIALATVPIFVWPGKVIGSRLQRVTREQMQLTADMGSLMNERFNVGGAMLTQLYGRPEDESRLFARKAGRVRDVAVLSSIYGRIFSIIGGLVASLSAVAVYGLGGSLVINGTFQIGTLVALVTLLNRVYVPVNQLSGLQLSTLTALVSFDRVFEVMDLKPLVVDRPDAASLPIAADGNDAAPTIEFDRVGFRYPTAEEVSLSSLESIGLPVPERADNVPVLHEVSFRAPPGKLTALVGPSGAGKTTITHLVPRLYDPVSGVVRIDGHDLRDLRLRSLRDMVGVVTQDPYLQHDTIRANLTYAQPQAGEPELIGACQMAGIWDLICSLPNRLDTVVGDRGYRLSGGEKQRIALARLLLKAPPIVILDEATAHLDSESEAAIQRALKTALAGRTSLVIAHRLSTVREADQILVIDGGQIRERGTHEELLAAAGLYRELYRTQFARQEDLGPEPSADNGARLG